LGVAPALINAAPDDDSLANVLLSLSSLFSPHNRVSRLSALEQDLLSEVKVGSGTARRRKSNATRPPTTNALHRIIMTTQANHAPPTLRPLDSDQEQMPFSRSKEDLETAESLLTHSQSGRLTARLLPEYPASGSQGANERYALPPSSAPATSDVQTLRNDALDSAEPGTPSPGYPPQSISEAGRTPPPMEASVTGQVCVYISNKGRISGYLTDFSTGIAEPPEPRFGDAMRMVGRCAMLVVSTKRHGTRHDL